MAQVRHHQKKIKRVLALDGHRLGLVGGTVLALAVMAACFYVRGVDGLTAATRTGWAFVAGYGAVFFLVRVILRTTLAEFIQFSESKKRKARLGRGERAAAAAAGKIPAGFAAQGIPDISLEAVGDLGVEHLGEPDVTPLSEELRSVLGGAGIERLGAGQTEPLSEGLHE